MNSSIKLLHDQIINEMKAGMTYRLLAVEMTKYCCDCLFKKFNANYIEEFKHSTDVIKMLCSNDLYDINLVGMSSTPAIVLEMVGVETIKQLVNLALSLEENNLVQWMTIDSACRAKLPPKTYAKFKDDVSSKMNEQSREIMFWRKVSDAITFLDDYNDIMDLLPTYLENESREEFVEGAEGGVMYTSSAPALHTGVVTTTGKSKKQKASTVQRRTLKDNN